ncbi:hypothetical protein [Agromyces sp. Root81]|uniref:hypothetical protein n=1 Tax=Agromyces sp. Root81 TaxID=1736601 RepID=UPI000B05F3AE|nr:hypothetical protein [Agromyces sp. Root81]
MRRAKTVEPMPLDGRGDASFTIGYLYASIERDGRITVDAWNEAISAAIEDRHAYTTNEG